MKTFSLFLTLALIGCSGCAPAGSTSKATHAASPDRLTTLADAESLMDAYDPNGQDAPQVGDVLVMGDSISIGYFPYLQAAFPDLSIVHSPGNAMNTDFTITYMDPWLNVTPKWKSIVFNNGMWDISSFAPTSPSRYMANLSAIADKVLAKTDHPIFVLTTQVPAHTPSRLDATVIAYNQIARLVMADKGIPVVDLYTVSTTIQDLHVDPIQQDDCHYIDAGYQVLSESVIAALQEVL